MAFAAKLGSLTEELITAITSLTAKSDRERLSACRESSLRKVRHNTFPRTNQFQVDEHLEGLQEKFIVNGRDGLAWALRQRLDALSCYSSKWTPEILHLLLELSDRPTQESSLADLDFLREPEEDLGPPLKWEDIAREDGWANDGALWKTVDFNDSSDEELHDDARSGRSTPSSDSEGTSVSSARSRLHRILKRDPDPVAQPSSAATLDDILKAQAWRSVAASQDSSGRARKTPISEAQIIREVLFMMQGHKTTLFDGKCEPVLTYQLLGVSWDTYRALITSIAESGRPLPPLRDFVNSRQEIPLLQMFQDCIRRGLRSFDTLVSNMQVGYVEPRGDVVVSLLAVAEELRPHLAPLHALSAVVQQLAEERYPHAFRYLELLFDATCLAQLQGDGATYRFLGPIFLDCFQVYLRPIRLWMEEGQLLAADKIFFVSESNLKVPLNQVWQSQFKLRRTRDGSLHAPRFLQPAMSRIFTTGKSVVVLKHLGLWQQQQQHQQQQDAAGTARDEEPSSPLAFDSLLPPADEGGDLAPFAELFAGAFDAWIKSKHRTASATLRRVLLESCGLWSTLDTLQRVFLMADGAAADGFASAVFGNVDRRNMRWLTDRFMLTEAAQESFSGSLVEDESRRVSAQFDAAAGGNRPRPPRSWGRTSVREALPCIKLHYRMAWPVQLILPAECIERYQAVFTLLLQLRRAIGVLNRHRLLSGFAAADLPAGYSHSHSRSGAGGHASSYYGLRARLLWFCNAFLTYLTTLVFSPAAVSLRRRLAAAEDVDAMIASHAAFLATLTDEGCLGARLGPIRECVLDVLDLAVGLEAARARDAAREAEELREMTRLSMSMSMSFMSSPAAPPRSPTSARKKRPRLRGRYVSPDEAVEDREGDDNGGDDGGDGGVFVGEGRRRKKKTLPLNSLGRRPGEEGEEEEEEELDYPETLRRISADFGRHLRFITGGLRGVARASGDAAAGKWDMLAEMLETGVVERPF